MTRKLQKVFCIIALSMVTAIPFEVSAYGVETHAAITQEIARFYNQFYPNHAFTQAEMKILMGGAIDEDDSLRFLNHFYDPIHKIGLTFGGQHLASKNWAQNSSAQLGVAYKLKVITGYALVASPEDLNSSDYTWKRAIQDYAEGKTERALEGLGHILHLIEDLTVPAHVRNDPHPPKDTVGDKLGDDDPYELWSHKFRPYVTDILIHMRDKQPVAGLGSLNKYFDELATYTNTKFFSGDTINKDYNLPSISNLTQVAIGKFTFLQSQDSGQNFVIAQKRGGSFTRDTEDLTTDNDIISQSTWDRLSVKAVQYGAGVVDLFFNEVEKLKKDPKFKPVEPKSLLGQFIDSIGENVGALVAGAPEPQPVAVVPIVPQLIIEEVVEPVEPVAPAPVPEVTDTTPVPIAPVILPVIQPVPVPVAPIPKVTTTSHSGGGGGDTDVEAEPAETEDVEEVVEDPPAEEEVVPEPEPEPEPEIDTTPPIDIEDLEAKDAQENTVTLEWTAPGDDGEIGTATSYELRYSPNSITDENWASTTSSGLVITPQAAGESESVEISGLAPMTTYYFALKAKDEAGNESALSNIASATTLIAKPNHIVISEVYPDMVGNDVNEIVELYNPTDAPINISGYSLQYLSGGATALLTAKKNFVSGATVPAKGFYLIGMWGNPAADMVWSESLHNTGATVFLVNDQLAIVDEADVNIVDRVAYGTGTGLLKPEGTITSLPGEGKSIERKALIDGMCQSAAGEEEFSGNGCDTGDNANDFEIRTSPKAQRTTNLFEPRNAPSAVSNSPAVLSNNAAGAQLQFAWSASLDASGNSSGMIYKIIDTSSSTAPVQLYNSSSLSFAKTINEIGREYKATIQAIDKDGLASAITELAVEVPGYLQELAFYRDPASASSSPSYLVRLVWDNYPFVPVGSARWHLAVFYYNKDAEKLAFLGQLNSGHNWGAGVSMPSAFKTSYKNCFSSGYTNNASSLILPDDAAHCSGLLGNIKASAIDFGLLRDKVLVLPVLPQTFGGVNPVAGQDYITVAYYFYSDGNSLGSDQRLIAVDKTRYYLEP